MSTIWIGNETLPDDRVEVDYEALVAALDSVRDYYRTNPDASDLDVLIVLRDAIDTVLPAQLIEDGSMSAARKNALRYWKLVAVYSSGELSRREVKYLVKAAWSIIPDERKRGLKPVRGVDF
jgi:hypothetical protein